MASRARTSSTRTTRAPSASASLALTRAIRIGSEELTTASIFSAPASTMGAHARTTYWLPAQASPT
eukprot:2925625-Prymnesium_polylepis.1